MYTLQASRTCDEEKQIQEAPHELRTSLVRDRFRFDAVLGRGRPEKGGDIAKPRRVGHQEPEEASSHVNTAPLLANQGAHDQGNGAKTQER